jgi:hypothetical protein
MPATPRRPPLEGVDRVIVDGTNLLYRLGASAGGPAPASAIVGRMRGAIPVTVAIDLVFDGVGHGVYGRLAQNMYVRYSGKRSGDDTILDLVSEAAMHGAVAADKVLVVSNDRPLRDKAMAKGARSIPLQWLIERLDVRLPAASGPGRGASIGAGRPPAGGTPGATGDEDDARRGWKPGRGATTKTGPPRKLARHKRHPR